MRYARMSTYYMRRHLQGRALECMQLRIFNAGFLNVVRHIHTEIKKPIQRHMDLSTLRSIRTSFQHEKTYDCVIVGGGVTGTALFYELANFTDVRDIALLERRHQLAAVTSGPNNNSQTIHCGDIETNYTLEKARKVKRPADMLRNFATKLPPAISSQCVARMPKSVLAVGNKEMEYMETRYAQFKGLYPKMSLLGKKQLAKVEPYVVMLPSNLERHEDVSAIHIADEHSAVNYELLTYAFVQQAMSAPNKNLDLSLSTEVAKIEELSDGTMRVHTNKGNIRAKFVVVSACGGSLVLAKRMGYAQQLSCLPVAGSFYFGPKCLNGKVYTVQDPALPFAAVHGDPDLIAGHAARFGPTALPIPLLERYNNQSFKEFLEIMSFDAKLLGIYFELFMNAHLRKYVLRNFVFEIPHLNRSVFASDAQKIVPGIKAEHLTYAQGFGGVRPQIINKKERRIIMGEGKVECDKNIIFNVTPSPGGTMCLGTAETDMRQICRHLGACIDEKKLKKALYEGQYCIDYV